MTRRYVPDSGDIVWLNFDPQSGREQAGYRPAVVLSSASYNGKTGMLVCCPMTTRVKGYPFEVSIAGTRPGAVLSDQFKSFDWRARKATYKGRVTASELTEIRRKLGVLIGLAPMTSVQS